MSSANASVSPSVMTVIGFWSIALFLAADYDGGVDMLDAMIEYVRAATAALEAKQ